MYIYGMTNKGVTFTKEQKWKNRQKKKRQRGKDKKERQRGKKRKRRI